MMITPEKKLIDADDGGLYWESRVSEALGVPRKMLAQLRGNHLTLGTDFVRRENNAVALTAAGLARIESLLATEIAKNPGLPGEKLGASALPPASPDVPAGPPEKEWMTVERVPQNIGLLLCIPIERPDKFVTIRVRDNSNFARGMILQAMKSGDGVWQFRNRENGDESQVGRLPRRKGSW